MRTTGIAILAGLLAGCGAEGGRGSGGLGVRKKKTQREIPVIVLDPVD